MRSTVCALEPVASGGVKLHLTGDGGIPSAFYAEATIVACGAHSAALTRTVGQGCPLDTERRHSITFSAGTEGLLKRAVCDPARGFIASPMAGGLRAVGTVELGGMHTGLTTARCEQLERSTAALFAPEMSHGFGRRFESLDWLGFRPTTPCRTLFSNRARRGSPWYRLRIRSPARRLDPRWHHWPTRGGARERRHAVA